MVNTIKNILLLMALLGHLGHAFGAMLFSGDIVNDKDKPCWHYIESADNDSTTLNLAPCEKHCASTACLFFSSASLIPQKPASAALDKLTEQFTSLDTSILLPPPK